MPRERINYPRELDYDPLPDPEASTGVLTADHDGGVPVYARRGSAGSQEPVVHVSWMAEKNGGGWVQVCFEADVYFKYIIEHPDGTVTSDQTTGYSPVLSRSELNKMIRALKRARDQAYGRDE